MRRPPRPGFVNLALHLCHGPTLTEGSQNKQNNLTEQRKGAVSIKSAYQAEIWGQLTTEQTTPTEIWIPGEMRKWGRGRVCISVGECECVCRGCIINGLCFQCETRKMPSKCTDLSQKCGFINRSHLNISCFVCLHAINNISFLPSFHIPPLPLRCHRHVI